MDIVFVNMHGVVVAQVDDGTMPITIDAQDPQAVAGGGGGGGDDGRVAEASAASGKGRELKPRVIVLGPKTRPPLPMSVHITPVVGRALRGHDRQPFVIRMDTDVQGDGLVHDVAWRLREAATRVAAGQPFALDVYLPAAYGVDVTGLSRYLADMGVPSDRPLQLRVGGQLAED